jgi:hypothetical protein
MCNKRKVLDRRIEYYQRIAACINDQSTIDRIEKLVEEMRSGKLALHPKDPGQRTYAGASELMASRKDDPAPS